MPFSASTQVVWDWQPTGHGLKLCHGWICNFKICVPWQSCEEYNETVRGKGEGWPSYAKAKKMRSLMRLHIVASEVNEKGRGTVLFCSHGHQRMSCCRFFVIFEKMEGGSLLKAIERRCYLTEQEASLVIRDVASALNFLHKKGMLATECGDGSHSSYDKEMRFFLFLTLFCCCCWPKHSRWCDASTITLPFNVSEFVYQWV